MTVKVLNSTIDNYNKYNLSLKYTEQSQNKSIVKFKISLYYEDKEMFNIDELIYKNNEALTYLNKHKQEIKNKEGYYNFMSNLEGIYVYAYYFDKADKWFVSTKRQINDYDVYKSFKRVLKTQNIDFNDFDKNYVYVFNLMSNKFIQYCSLTDKKYDFLEFIKKVECKNSKTYETPKEKIEYMFINNPILTTYLNKQDYDSEAIDLNNEIKMKLDYLNHSSFKNNNGFLKNKGLKIYCFSGNKNKLATLMIDSDVYKYFSYLKYNYQKYKINIRDVLFLSQYILYNKTPYNNTEFKNIIDNTYSTYWGNDENKLKEEKEKYKKIYNNFINNLEKYHKKEDKQNYPKSLIYFYDYVNKHDDKTINVYGFRTFVYQYCSENINLLWSLYNGVLKLESQEIDKEHCKIQ